MHELAWAEPVNVDVREPALDVREQIQIPLLRQFRMVSALHQDLGATKRNGLFNFFVHFVEGDDVSIIILFRAVKSAELAVNIADVRVVDVSIDDVSDDIVPAAFPDVRSGELAPTIGESSELLEGQLRKLQGLARSDSFAVPDLLLKVG